MRLPIKALKELGKKYKYDVVVVYAYDSKNNMHHVATWGRSIKLCDQAAQWGNMMKDALGWPKSLHGIPNRVKKLQDEIKYWQKAAGRLATIANWMYNFADQREMSSNEVDQCQEMFKEIQEYLSFNEGE